MLARVGTSEIIVILIVAFLIFGPDKLPELGRNIGKALSHIQKYMREATDEIREAAKEIEDIEKEVKNGTVTKKAVQTDDKEPGKISDEKCEV